MSFVEPLAAGSGIAEVKTYLNGIHIRGLLTVRAPVLVTCACVQGFLGGLEESEDLYYPDNHAAEKLQFTVFRRSP